MADPNELISFSVGATRYALNVPPVIVGVILASGISAFVAWRTNRNSRAQVQMQLDHAERSKALELKREVFLRAADWAQTSINATAKLARLDLNSDEVSAEMNKRAHVVAEIEIVGTPKTVESALRFQNAYGASFTRILQARNKIDDCKGFMDACYVEIVKHAPGSHERRVTQMRIDATTAELKQLYPPYASMVFDEVKATVSLAAELTLCVREEMGFPISADTYREIAERMNAEGRRLQQQVTELNFPAVPKTAEVSPALV